MWERLGIGTAAEAVDLVYEIYGEYASEVGGYGADRWEYLLRAWALHSSLQAEGRGTITGKGLAEPPEQLDGLG